MFELLDGTFESVAIGTHEEMHPHHSFTSNLGVFQFLIVIYTVQLLALCSGYDFYESRIIVDVDIEGFGDLFQRNKLLVVVLHALMFLLAKLDEVYLRFLHCFDRLLATSVAEVYTLKNSSESDDIFFFVCRIKTGVLGQSGFHVLVALPKVFRIYLFEFLLDLFCAGEPTIKLVF